MAANERSAPFVLNSLPTFAMHRLLLRLPAVQEQFVNVEIRVSSGAVDRERLALDCAITYGGGH